MAAPVGNQNAVKAKRWREAILRALARCTGTSVDAGLDQAADRLVALAMEGDRWAIDHIADRIDGKASQGIQLEDSDGTPLGLSVTFGRHTADDRVSPEARMPLSS
jgi:hypothetical protein